MDQPSVPVSTILPLAQVSAAQLAQAILTAREALSIYYPAVTIEQWQQAFEKLDFPLYVSANRVATTALGLRSLIDYFEEVLSSPAVSEIPNMLLAVSQQELPHELSAVRKVKKTYEMRADVLEPLARASFWRRVGKSQLVNRALLQLLTGMPESRVPIPPGES